MTTPVKRRPGRPRKNPLPDAEAPATSTEIVVAPAEIKPPSDPADPRIGLRFHPDATHVGFDDGSVYEAKDGYLIRRAY